MNFRAETRRLTGPIDGGSGGATVAVEPLLCGRIDAPSALFDGSTTMATARMLGLAAPGSRSWSVPVPAYLVHHPAAGPFIVDTGLHPSVASRPSANMGRLLARFARPRLEPGADLPAQLRGRGIDPRSIRLVVMTHLHFDHSSAMAEFMGATFVLDQREWAAATTDRRPVLRGYRPEHYDYAFDYRTLRYNAEPIRSYSSFGRTFDLFGDGSVRLASTPGHSAGHQSLICRLRDRDLVIAGDAIYTRHQLNGGPEPPQPADLHNWRRSLRELTLFASQYPQALILPGHDPEYWETLERRYE